MSDRVLLGAVLAAVAIGTTLGFMGLWLPATVLVVGALIVTVLRDR